jgi:uncharacterized protein (TIGR02246 family)
VKQGLKALTRLFLLLAIGAGTFPAAQAAPADPDTAVAALVPAWVKAWNKHDANDLGRLLGADVDFVTVAGVLLNGQEEFRRVHAGQFAGRYDKSIFTADGTPRVTFIRPDVALVHWRWTITEVRNADGTPAPPYRGIFTWVVVAADGTWKIRASQNTIVN